MRKLLQACVPGFAAVTFWAAAAAAQGECVGTSGTATIDANPWTAVCVIAATATDCVDSTGADYECFQIAGTSATDPNYQTIAIFLDGAPVQGMTYDLGGTSAHGAMVVGSGGFFLTGEAPNTGQVQVTRYDAAGGIIECNFSFVAENLFFPQSLTVTAGQFAGRLVGVAPTTWTGLKNLYRD